MAKTHTLRVSLTTEAIYMYMDGSLYNYIKKQLQCDTVCVKVLNPADSPIGFQLVAAPDKREGFSSFNNYESIKDGKVLRFLHKHYKGNDKLINFRLARFSVEMDEDEAWEDDEDPVLLLKLVGELNIIDGVKKERKRKAKDGNGHAPVANNAWDDLLAKIKEINRLRASISEVCTFSVNPENGNLRVKFLKESEGE